MPMIVQTIPDADFSSLGIGKGDTPFSVKPFAGYILGSKHVALTDYTNLNDFCGTQGDLVPTGTHSGVNNYDEQLSSSVYYDTPFTLAQHFAAGSGSASMVVVAKPSLNACMWCGLPISGAARLYLQTLVATSPALSSQANVYDDAGVSANFSLTVPGADGSAQYTMHATSVTPTSNRGYVQNANGVSTAAAVTKASGTYTSTGKYRMGQSQGVGSYPGPVNVALALFFAGDQYSYFPTLYNEIKAWFNEHGLGM